MKRLFLSSPSHVVDVMKGGGGVMLHDTIKSTTMRQIVSINSEILTRVADDVNYFFDNKGMIMRLLQEQAMRISETVDGFKNDPLCKYIGDGMNNKTKKQCISNIKHPMQTLQSFLGFYNERGLLDGSHCSTVMVITGAGELMGGGENDDDDDGEIENLEALQNDINVY